MPHHLELGPSPSRLHGLLGAYIRHEAQQCHHLALIHQDVSVAETPLRHGAETRRR